ncbi:GbNV_gp58-like [Fopius arisanus]|nr:GbNV_gp58-like [Fopius arisanus]
MLKFLAILTFAVTAFCMIFAKDSYINRELETYQRTLHEPWMHRLVLLKYKPRKSLNFT